MSALREGIEESLHLLIQQGVVTDRVFPDIELGSRRQLLEEQQVCDFEEGRIRCEVLDGVAAVLQDARTTVDVSDR